MRFHVVTDASGALVAYGRGSGEARKGRDQAPQVQLEPMPGQTVHDVVLAEEWASRPEEELHELFTDAARWRQYVTGTRVAELPSPPAAR